MGAASCQTLGIGVEMKWTCSITVLVVLSGASGCAGRNFYCSPPRAASVPHLDGEGGWITSGAYESRDGGRTWTLVEELLRPAPPPDVVVDEDEEGEDWEPVVTLESEVPGWVAPPDLFARARSHLAQHGIRSYAECAHATCWLAVPAADADAAVRVLAADAILAPFSSRRVEVVEGTDARVLRSRTRGIADRAGEVLRDRGIEPMVEESDEIFEVWVDTAKYRESAMKVLRADPALLPYVARSRYGRDQSSRPGLVSSPR